MVVTAATNNVLAATEQALITAFLDQLWLDKGVSEHTLSAYGTDLRKFALFLAQQKKSLLDADSQLLNRYLADDTVPGHTTVIRVTEQHHYRISVTEVARFTTTLQITLLDNGTALFRPHFVVRLYHDAQAAEVLACQHISRFKARYDYPNTDMLLPDEKRQINLLLRDWLKLCTAQGYVNRELAFG